MCNPSSPIIHGKAIIILHDVKLLIVPSTKPERLVGYFIFTNTTSNQHSSITPVPIQYATTDVEAWKSKFE